VIIGEKTRLRAIERADIPLFVRWFNDPEVLGFLSMYLPMSEAAEEQWFERQLADSKSLVFVIETMDGTPIGNLGFCEIDQKNRHAWFGISICEAGYRDRGFGTDALDTLLKFAFEEMNLNRVALRVLDYNHRAIRCYEKVGFKREGRLRQSHFSKGRYVDELVMGILSSEWQEREREA